MLRIRTMTSADLDLGMRLKQAAGWNQTIADWKRFLALEPEGCFVAEVDGQGVGTATTCLFGSVAWIAMVLVDPASRGHGVGTALMNHALAHLDARQVPTVRLDATPLGRPIYEKLGFKPDFDLQRYVGMIAPAGGAAPSTPPRTAAPGVPGSACAARPGFALESLAGPLPADLHSLDAAVTATPRAKLIDRLHADQPGATRVAKDRQRLAGYAMTRPGANATHVGPCIASDAEVGIALLNDAVDRLASAAAHEAAVSPFKVFVDIPDANAPTVAWARERGLAPQRPLYRMTRGRAINEDPMRLFASTGPEMG
ncbi:MAG: GNAT family N-acetyltransferase [Planctomycetota bacterium]|nr:GNAT family N-acetyltransferase [Planctomycetota bacterium]